MKFRRFGQASLAAAASTCLLMVATSCSNDHTVGYIYVTGTQYNNISEFKEDNNNGTLTAIENNATVGSGGSNPVRAIIPSGSHFVYVLNEGTPTATLDSAGNPTGGTTYSGGNISVFSIGGYGQLVFQYSYTSQGLDTSRIATDAAGTHLYVLDTYNPTGGTTNGASAISSAYSASYPCQDASNKSVYHPTGDITAFNIDTSTGRLSLITNAQNTALTYFPVGCNPVDLKVASSYIYTMDAGAASNNDVETAYVYGETTATGQLTTTQNSAIPITGASSISSIGADASSTHLYFLDAGNNFIYPYTIGTSGALTAIASGGTDNGSNSAVGNPQQMIFVAGSPNNFVYVANAGPASGSTNIGNSDVSGYVVDATTGHLDQASTLSPYGLTTVSGAVCIFEDPSNQYIYVAGSLDNSITGRKFDPQTGSLTALNKATSWATVGTPSWCVGTTSER